MVWRLNPETGLYYYRAKYYAPTLDRFLQTDPVGYKDDLNLYAYVANDPTDKTDPTGLECVIQNGNGCRTLIPSNQQDVQHQVGHTTEGSLAKVLTNEDGSLSTSKGGDPQQLVDGKTALANAIYNNANLVHPEKVAPDTGTASAQDSKIMHGVVKSRQNGGADPIQGRHYYGTSHFSNLKSRDAGNHLEGNAGREKVFAKFGPFHDSQTPQTPTYIYIYNDQGQ